MIDATTVQEALSFMDCTAGYNQIHMAPEDQDATTFRTPKGIFCYKVMPFGLKNAGATYQRAMQKIFKDMMHKTIECYVDDVVVKSKAMSDHVQDLRTVFERLRKCQLKMNPLKCAFRVTSRKFLGFVVTHRGIDESYLYDSSNQLIPFISTLLYANIYFLVWVCISGVSEALGGNAHKRWLFMPKTSQFQIRPLDLRRSAGNEPLIRKLRVIRRCEANSIPYNSLVRTESIRGRLDGQIKSRSRDTVHIAFCLNVSSNANAKGKSADNAKGKRGR
ncbi:unnamed protein product [Rhodiola kirilowii]